jgi:hypothetical protein
MSRAPEGRLRDLCGRSRIRRITATSYGMRGVARLAVPCVGVGAGLLRVPGRCRRAGRGLGCRSSLRLFWHGVMRPRSAGSIRWATSPAWAGSKLRTGRGVIRRQPLLSRSDQDFCRATRSDDYSAEPRRTRVCGQTTAGRAWQLGPQQIRNDARRFNCPSSLGSRTVVHSSRRGSTPSPAATG